MKVLKKLWSGLWVLVDCLLLILSVLLLAIVVLQAVPQLGDPLGATSIAVAVTGLLPPQIAFIGVVPSPLGGVFRTDFLLIAIACMVLARLVRALSKGLI